VTSRAARRQRVDSSGAWLTHVIQVKYNSTTPSESITSGKHGGAPLLHIGRRKITIVTHPKPVKRTLISEKWTSTAEIERASLSEIHSQEYHVTRNTIFTTNSWPTDGREEFAEKHRAHRAVIQYRIYNHVNYQFGATELNMKSTNTYIRKLML
jgi:hypothetical protein